MNDGNCKLNCKSGFGFRDKELTDDRVNPRNRE